MKHTLLCLLSCLFFWACKHEEKKEALLPFFQDPIVQSIYNFQDQRDTDSLKLFLNHENPVYRKLAATAFGSVQDSAAIPSLFSVLMHDSNSSVRKATAYALGQTYDSTAAHRLLESLDLENDSLVRESILTAIGKCISAPDLPLFNQFHPQNIPEKRGFMLGLYYAGLRNVFDPLSVEIAAAFLKEDETWYVRLAAAHFLSRNKNMNIDSRANAIVSAVNNEKAANVRMALTLALGKLHSPASLKALLNLTKDVDYRVRVNALTALGGVEDVTSLQAVTNLLNDSNHHVAVKASEIIRNRTLPFPEGFFDSLIQENYHWRVKRNLQQAALKKTQDPEMAEQLKSDFGESQNPYEQAAILSALSAYLPAYEFVVTQTLIAPEKAVSTAGIITLASYRKHPDFPNELKDEFAEIIKKAMLTGDLALIGISSSLLLDSSLGFKQQYENFDFLYEAKKLLSLPKDNEALQTLEKTIAWFEGKEYEEVKNEYNHPLDWDFISQLHPTDTAVIVTTEGDITLKLLTQESPGSVANFLKLAQSGYYNGIAFHRVVPNFVVQGGCNRGDGWGGLDYSIRSELGPRTYTSGSVGMASAGKDTEGTQLFITHSPTMHLDGKYTIFAEIIEGMNVVNELKMGSRIVKITGPF